jgi:NAD(P)-dependent dehydrogenase (short-subunit alcohol dehydrogenase family)
MTTVLITGANRGIGLELTRQYAAQGAKVLACCRDPGEASALQELAKGNANIAVHGVKVTDAASVAALAAAVGGAPIDVLINNAGTATPARQSLADMDYDGWLDAFGTNTLAPFRMLQTFRENLKASGGGKVCTVTSQFGAMAYDVPMVYAYSATKAAVNKVMRMASIELIKEGTITIIIHPGWVKTDMGGPQGQQTPEESAAGIISVIAGLTPAQNGGFFKWNGEAHAW